MTIFRRTVALACVSSLALSACGPRSASSSDTSATSREDSSQQATVPPRRTKADASAVAACARLAAGPLEVVDGHAGATLDNMLSGEAVDACESAVAYAPNDAAAWRRLARAHTAEVIVRDLPPAVHLGRAREATVRAAKLGDPLARVQTALWPAFGQTMDRKATPAVAQALLRELETSPSASVEDAFARVMVQAVLLQYEPVPEPASGKPVDYYNARQAKLASSQAMASLRAAVQQSSWGAASAFQRDLNLLEDCNDFPQLCELFDTGLKTSGDPAAMLEVAAQWAQRADALYKRGRVLANPTTPKPSEFYRAQTSSMMAMKLADLAVEAGNPRQAEAAASLKQAALALRREITDAEATARYTALVNQRNADAAATLAFFGVLAIAFAAAGGGDAPPENSAQKYADIERRERCNWARSTVLFPSGVNGDTLKSAQYQVSAC